MAKLTFEGTGTWKSGTECDLTVEGKHIATVSPPPEFGGKQGSRALCVQRRYLQHHSRHV